MDMKEFFAMGGYAFYVWTSYGLALVVLAFNIIQPLLHKRRALKRIARQVRRSRRTA
jgi:heme exporter protein D